MTWGEFGQWFIRLYGGGAKVDGALNAWIAEVYTPAGITPDEARAAVIAAATRRASTFAVDVLAAVPSAVAAARVETLLAMEVQDREGGADVTLPGCRLCGGAGWVSVPAVPQPAEAEAKGYLQTAAVTCACIAGLRLSGVKNTDGECAMTLTQYEARHGEQWYDELEAHKKRKAAQGRLAGAAKEWDGLARRLLNGTKEAHQCKSAALAVHASFTADTTPTVPTGLPR